VKFGIIFANVGPAVAPDYAAEMGRIVEESGFDSVWTVEHVVVPAGYESAYPYSPTGRMPGPEESPIPDPLIWLAYMAACTSTIKLATGVLILPQRNPVVLAKEVATLDVLSKGRAILGPRTDDHVHALRALWTQEVPSHRGPFVEFENAKMYPKPVNGTVPIVVGGHTRAAARRAGRLGDGFFPARTSPEELGGLLEEMRRAAKDAGRDPDAIEVTAGGVLDLDGVRRFADLGVQRIAVPPLGFDLETLKQQLGNFADNVINKVS